MRQITRKYLFECKLKGAPVDLTDYNNDEDWDKVIPSLIEIGLISKEPKTNISTDINKDKGPEDRWYFQYPVQLNRPNLGPAIWTPKPLCDL